MGNQQTMSPDMFNSTNQNTVFDENDKNNTLLVKTYTWSRDSHGLYDYKGQNTFKQDSFKINNPGSIIRKDEGILFKSDLSQSSLRDDDDLNDDITVPLLNINQIDNLSYRVTPHQFQHQFHLFAPQLSQNEQQMWLIVRSLKNIQGAKNGCMLKENDFIKLGRVRFRISEINISFNDNDNDTQTEKESLIKKNNKPSTTQNLNKKGVETQGTVPQEDLPVSQDEIQVEGKSCRFCLSDTQTKDDPLMCPCKCNGSVQHVHIECLKMWLQNKITSKSSPYSTQYSWKDLKCELCQYQYPHTIYENGRPFQTFFMKKPSGPYIILEILGKDNNISKGIHILSLAEKQVIKIGRGSDSDMKVQDISVSRQHAAIKLIKGNIYLEDLNSKFGTLALIKSHIDISQNTNKLAIQVNRTVFSFYMKQLQQQTAICGGKKKKVQEFILNPPETILSNNNANKIQDPVLQYQEEEKRKKQRYEEIQQLKKQLLQQHLDDREDQMYEQNIKLIKNSSSKKLKLISLENNQNQNKEKDQFYSKNMQNFDQLFGNKNQDMLLFQGLDNKAIKDLQQQKTDFNNLHQNQYLPKSKQKTLFQEQKENEQNKPKSYTFLNMNEQDNQQYPPLEQFKEMMKQGNIPDNFRKMANQFPEIPENEIQQNQLKQQQQQDISNRDHDFIFDHDFEQNDIEEQQNQQSTIYFKNMHANNLGHRTQKGNPSQSDQQQIQLQEKIEKNQI